MTDRNQAVAICALAALGALSLVIAWSLLARADAPEQIQAAVAIGAVASNVVSAIAGFMAGRATTGPGATDPGE